MRESRRKGLCCDMPAKFVFSADDYQLLDFGHGRRLERFGGYVLDRPCPAVAHLPQGRPDCWNEADARFHRRAATGGVWELLRHMPDRWFASCGPLRFELKRTDFGQVGMFPEQAVNWQWLYERIGQILRPEQRCSGGASGTWALASDANQPPPPCANQPAGGQRVVGQSIAAHAGSSGDCTDARPSLPASLRVLNLFAYTGGSTLAAAAAGAEVVHVDAAKNVVAWARRNGELSGLADRPIHWVVEDAMKFVKRELRRANRYHAVILDPPSYGHGRRGEVWRLSKHLSRLLELCAELTASQRQFVLLTAHTPGFGPRRLAAMLATAFGGPPQASITSERLLLPSSDGRSMPCGVVARWTPHNAVTQTGS